MGSITRALRPELAGRALRSHNGAMEHEIVYSALLFISLMSPITWSYRRNRPMNRMQRGLRSYIARIA